jgi:PAS domain S-box-containing protein
MLSARAGESSAIEGLSRGADDYLVKPFSSEELLARVFAQLNAKAIRDRSIEALRLNEERFRSLAASMPHIVLEAHPDDGITFLSQAYAEYCGVPVEAGYGSGWRDVVHRDDYPALMESWENAVRDASDFESEFRLRRKDGAYRWYVGRAVAQRDDRGRPVRYTGTVTDIHDMRRSVQERAFLSEASRIMSQTLDLELTLRGLADSTVPQFADWCQIHLTEPDGIRVLAISHVDSEKHALAQRLVGRLHFNRDALEGTPLVLRTGRPTIMDEPDRTAAEVVNDEPELKIYRRLGLGSAVVVPLVAEGRTLGTISLVYAQSGRRYSEDDVPVLEELGRRAGVAVRRANEFQREHRVAQSFQEASLPAELPAIAGATFDAVYVPADNDVQVGGDWYDAMRLVDGRIVLSIGDVAGNGLRAAVTMGNIRQIIRGIAQVHADPALMLDAADRALRLEHPDQYVTAFVGVYDPIAETFAYASAGHPPAMLRRPEGTIELLSDGGLPLGLRQISKENGKTVRVGPGSYLVLYTDGLTEATRRPADGEARLLSMLVNDEGHALLASPHPAEALRQALLGGTPAKDDVAIMVVGIHPGAEPGLKTTDSGAPHVQRWFFATNDAEAAQSARREFGDGLRLRHADEEMLYKAQVVFGELVGNAARYAPGTIEVTVDWTGPLPVLHIFDNGPGFHHIPALPRDVYSESGRGLFIISLMSEDFSVSRRPDGGSHARAVLALRGTPSRSIA